MTRESKPMESAVLASAGRLSLSAFVVVSTVQRPLVELKQQLESHLGYLASLEESGKLLMAGPLGNEDGTTWSGDGQLVYLAADLSEAESIARADPLHSSGVRSFTIRPWIINDGAMQISLRFSNQKIRIEKEKRS
jgi:uncharacterized protein